MGMRHARCTEHGVARSPRPERSVWKSVGQAKSRSSRNRHLARQTGKTVVSDAIADAQRRDRRAKQKPKLTKLFDCVSQRDSDAGNMIGAGLSDGVRSDEPT